jgi:lipopolysaccharide export system protein LptA
MAPAGAWCARLAAIVLAGATLGGAASAQAPAKGIPNAVQGFSKNRDKPVNIEAATLEVRDKDKTATFSGNVHVVQGDTTMRCKVLVVHYDSNTPGAMKAATPGAGGSQQISRLEAKGGVIVTQAEQTATGDTGLFDMKSNTITLLGNVVVSQGGNVVRGERLVVDMTTGVSKVDAGASKGPVRMLIEQNKDGTTTQKQLKFPLSR